MPFQDLPSRLAAVRENIERARVRGGHQQTVTIVAVTKTYGPEAPLAALDAGLQDVGENRVQEALTKMPLVTRPVRWHMIGHLQRNKVKQLDGFHLVHSMDSARLADALAAHGAARGRPMDVLLQVNVSGEGTKGGYVPADVAAEAVRLRSLPGIVLHGVMTMAPLDADMTALCRVFAGARRCREQL
jgi:PLP dependent protein